ncbi:polynucleotide kinase 3 phosphatase-domain-containing protein [Mycena amicta]|nr:polynucleotide kinase 3 phosphatase-domain-containing protein [Mycena amicta]
MQASTTLRWLTPLGPSTCLHGVNFEPQSSKKVAMLDLDNTIIEDTSFQPKWRWWNACVPANSRRQYAIVIITNQAGLTTSTSKDEWKQKLGLIAAAIPDIPFRIFAAIAYDNYRKPRIGMWEELDKIFVGDGGDHCPDKSASFFVGDAAGRLRKRNGQKDFAGTDRKWALNVNVPFFTPEVPSTVPLFTPSSSPLLPETPIQELVLFVGYPCIGKTTLFRQYFESKGYEHINLKMQDRSVKAVDEALAAKRKCVVDNSNHLISTRQLYLDVAKKHEVPVRRVCMVFTGSLELAWHNNLYRAFYSRQAVGSTYPPTHSTDIYVDDLQHSRELLPISDFTSFKNRYEESEPKLDEGFKVKRIHWVFTGSEEERRAWGMWLEGESRRGFEHVC